MTRDREQGARVPVSAAHAVQARGDLDLEASTGAPEQAYAALEQLAKSGRGDPKRLPILVQRLDRDHKVKFWDLIPSLEARVPGDLHDIPAAQLVMRIADLSVAERAAIVAERARLERVVPKLAGEPELLERALFLLGPSIAQLVVLPLGRQPGLVSYLRTRPADEEAAVLTSPKLLKPARAMFASISPFVVFPSLHQPSTLAAALDASPGVLAWLLEGADADLVLTCLARPGVRERAAALIEADRGVYAKLPLYQQLTERGQHSFDQLASAIEDEDAQADADQYVDLDPRRSDAAAQRGETIAEARDAGRLWDALERLRAASADPAAIHAILRAYPDDQIELLGGSHPAAVRYVRYKLALPPQHVFPALDARRLLSLDDARTWMLEDERPYLVLGLVARNAEEIKQLAVYLLGEPATARTFFEALPRGANLTPTEQRVIDELRGYFGDDALLHLMFEVRFASKLEGANLTHFDVHRLWNVLARLPPAQVDQEVIESFVERDAKALGETGTGYWDGKHVVIKDELDGRDKMFERTPLLTTEEVKQYYGLEGAALDQAAGEHGWLKRVGDKFQVKAIKVDQFTTTVLHEVGHSVDTLLGERTELVFGHGGWRVYGIDQFEDWARDMNALDGIPGSDRTKIIDAWRRALRSGSKIDALVDELHPARSDKYDHSPLVQAAREGARFHWQDPLREANGRVWTTGNNQGLLCSTPTATADVAPTKYAMSAPAEFFAECYVEYYRGYDGTPATVDKKGGRLAAWIKQWFDAHVDTIRLSPQRVRKQAEDPAE